MFESKAVRSVRSMAKDHHFTKEQTAQAVQYVKGWGSTPEEAIYLVNQQRNNGVSRQTVEQNDQEWAEYGIRPWGRS